MPDMDKIIKQVAMDNMPSRLSEIIGLLKGMNEKLDRILVVLEEEEE
jgi:hypothetical protein